ncbi:MAG: helix-turn-helix domain-containing protein [Terracoccus sp.]
MSSQLEQHAADTTQPLQALRAVVGLRSLADRLELHQVQAALDAGHTWPEIAAALGVTRQAVHKKYHRRVRVERGRP